MRAADASVQIKGAFGSVSRFSLLLISIASDNSGILPDTSSKASLRNNPYLPDERTSDKWSSTAFWDLLIGNYIA